MDRYVHACTYTHMHIYTRMYTHIHTHTHTHTLLWFINCLIIVCGFIFVRGWWGARLKLYFYRLQPLETRVCDTIDKDVVEIRMSDAKKLGVAGFLTEW